MDALNDPSNNWMWHVRAKMVADGSGPGSQEPTFREIGGVLELLVSPPGTPRLSFASLMRSVPGQEVPLAELTKAWPGNTLPAKLGAVLRKVLSQFSTNLAEAIPAAK